MEIRHYVKQICYWLIAIISAGGMRCDLRSKQELLYDFEKEFSSLRSFFLCLTRSFSKDRLVGLCLAAAIIFLINKTESVMKERRPSGKRICLISVYSLFFGLVQVLCRSLRYKNSLDPLVDSDFAVFRTGCIFIAYTVVCFLVVFLLFDKIDTFHSKIDAENIKNGSADNVAKKSKWFYIIPGAVILLVLWIPYLILFYPGVCNIDSTDMLMQFLGYKTYIVSLSSVVSPDITISNHHPFFDTYVFGSFYKLGRDVIGDVSIGIFLYGLTMLTLFAAVFSAVWYYVRTKTSGSKGPFRILFLFIGLFPLFSIYSFSMLKDTLFSFSCLLFTFILILTADGTEDRLKSNWFLIGTILAGILLTLTKNQGVYVLILTFLFTLILLFIDQIRKKKLMKGRLWIRLSAAFIIPIVFFIFIWSRILLPLWNVAPGGKQEAIGFMFQQTAACLKLHGDDVTEEEKEAISAILPYDTLAERYNPEKHDSVKFTYKQSSTDEELKAYYKAWLAMGMRHPKTYIVAILNSCYGYFYISESGGFTYTWFITEDNGIYLGGENIFVGDDKISFISAMQEGINAIPIVNFLVGMSVPVWIILFCVAYLLDRGTARSLIGTLVGFISVGVFLLSPDNSNGRYVMPLYYIAIVLIAVIIYRINFDDKEAEIQQ